MRGDSASLYSPLVNSELATDRRAGRDGLWGVCAVGLTILAEDDNSVVVAEESDPHPLSSEITGAVADDSGSTGGFVKTGNNKSVFKSSS